MRLRVGKFRIYAAVILGFCALGALKTRAQDPSSGYVDKQAPMEHMSGLLKLVETIPIPTEESRNRPARAGSTQPKSKPATASG